VPLIIFVVDKLLQLYTYMIMIYTFGSFFPQWRFQAWYRWIAEFVFPYLSLFRGLNLRSGNIDFTPLAAIVVLQLISMGLRATMRGS